MDKEYEYPVDWRAFSKKIQDEINSNYKVCCILLIGPKNSGKTTFLMENVKKLVCKKPDSYIYILDCDLGQPLVSPPSCVKVVRWSQTNFNIGERNINTFPDLMFYVGGNSPINYPLRYLKAVKECINYIKLLGRKNIFLFVNLPGWVTGIGFEIISIIASFCVEVSNKVIIGYTKEIQDKSEIESTNFHFSKTFDLSSMKNVMNHNISINNNVETNVFITTLSDLLIRDGDKDISNNQNALIYFEKYISYFPIDSQNLCRVIHFPFNSICIIPSINASMNSYELKYHMENRLINSVVALCICRDEKNQYIPCFNDLNTFNILETDMFFPCVGFGIIHHVNYKSNNIVIIIPKYIPTSSLSEVNIIQLTEIMLPYYYPFYTSSPYICKKEKILQGNYSGGKVPGNRRNVKRKIHII